MKRVLAVAGLVFVMGLAFLSESGIANAEPAIRHVIQGSNVLIYADNRENVKYNCNVSWTLLYRDFGENKSRNFQQPAEVAPNFSGLIINSATSYESASLQVRNFTPACFRASAASPAPSATRLPGGTYHETCHGCVMNGSVLSCRCDGNDTSLNVDTCGAAGRNLICNENGNLRCPGRC